LFLVSLATAKPLLLPAPWQGSWNNGKNSEKELTVDGIIDIFAVPSAGGTGKALLQLDPIQFDSSPKKRCLNGDGWVSEKNRTE
jgi:hypothetical protein